MKTVFKKTMATPGWQEAENLAKDQQEAQEKKAKQAFEEYTKSQKGTQDKTEKEPLEVILAKIFAKLEKLNAENEKLQKDYSDLKANSDSDLQKIMTIFCETIDALGGTHELCEEINSQGDTQI